MGEEIETPEAPNWLKELEAKREHRLKARLGHEAGAGAPCLNCEQSCPGLDLHFWRKICKNCKCSKEDHDVHDDDLYGWAQFQLLGSKPNKIKKKIVLPGKKDEVELEWAPKGQKETVDKFLKTLPPELLPVKGSQAAQERKQMLQKQIPIHDIDPSLCHDLTESELKQMNEYIAHMKQNSVGVGKVVQIGTQVGNVHTLGGKDRTLLTERYPKGIPTSELVKLQAHSSANMLPKKLSGMSLDNKTSDRYPVQNHIPNSNVYAEDVTPCNVGGVRDINAPIYVGDAQGCRLMRPPNDRKNTLFNAGQGKQMSPKQFTADPANPSKMRDVVYPTTGGDPHLQRQACNRDDVEVFDPSQLLPQNLPNITVRPSEMHQKPYSPNVKTCSYPHYEQDVRGSERGTVPGGFVDDHGGKMHRHLPNYKPGGINVLETLQNPVNQSLNMENYPQYVTQENAINANQMVLPQSEEERLIGNPLKDNRTLPHFAPTKFKTYGDTQTPTKIGNLKDLAFSTYDPDKIGSNEDLPYLNDPNRNKLAPQFEGRIPHQYYDDQSPMKTILRQKYGDFNQNKLLDGDDNTAHDEFTESLRNRHDNLAGNQPYDRQQFLQKLSRTLEDNLPYDQTRTLNDQNRGPYDPNRGPYDQNKVVYDQMRGPYEEGAPHDQNRASYHQDRTPYEQNRAYDQNRAPYDQNSSLHGENVGTLGPQANKPLPHLNPTSLHITENKRDPLPVNVGLINDVIYQMPEIKAAASEENPLHQRHRVPEPSSAHLDVERLPTCHRCMKMFAQDEFAVQIEQNSAFFHPECLRCAGCNQILADMFYFYDVRSNEVYCLRDYAKIRGIPRCTACDELIFVKEYTLAENNTFHIKHFCCFECDEPLAGKNYIMEESQPVCLPCYEKLKANRCRACANIIKPDEQGANLKGVHFHASDVCFSCKVCTKPLLGAKLMFKNETLYCSPDCYMADQ